MWEAYFLMIFTVFVIGFTVIMGIPPKYVDMYTGKKYKVICKGYSINYTVNRPRYCYILEEVKKPHSRISVFSEEIEEHFQEVMF